MRKSLILAASLGAMLISTAAFAATMDATGFIKSVHVRSHSFTLSNGKTYALPAGFAMKNLKTGEKVRIAFHVWKKHLIATSVKAV